MTDERKRMVEKWFHKNCILAIPSAEWRDEDFEYFVEYMRKWSTATLTEWANEE